MQRVAKTFPVTVTKVSLVDVMVRQLTRSYPNTSSVTVPRSFGGAAVNNYSDARLRFSYLQPSSILFFLSILLYHFAQWSTKGNGAKPRVPRKSVFVRWRSNSAVSNSEGCPSLRYLLRSEVTQVRFNRLCRRWSMQIMVKFAANSASPDYRGVKQWTSVCMCVCVCVCAWVCVFGSGREVGRGGWERGGGGVRTVLELNYYGIVLDGLSSTSRSAALLCISLRSRRGVRNCTLSFFLYYFITSRSEVQKSAARSREWKASDDKVESRVETSWTVVLWWSWRW